MCRWDTWVALQWCSWWIFGGVGTWVSSSPRALWASVGQRSREHSPHSSDAGNSNYLLWRKPATFQVVCGQTRVLRQTFWSSLSPSWWIHQEAPDYPRLSNQVLKERKNSKIGKLFQWWKFKWVENRLTRKAGKQLSLYPLGPGKAGPFLQSSSSSLSRTNPAKFLLFCHRQPAAFSRMLLSRIPVCHPFCPLPASPFIREGCTMPIPS